MTAIERGARGEQPGRVSPIVDRSAKQTKASSWVVAELVLPSLA